MIVRRVITTIVLSAVFLTPLSTYAQSPADVALARDLFKEGAKFAQDGQWNDARIRYEKSLALKRAPLTLYSLGIAYRHLRRFVESLESYRAFLVEMDKQDERDQVYEQPARDAVAELEKLVAQIDITIIPRDDDRKMMLTIDGIIVPEAAYGYPRLVDPGTHQVIVRSRGYREATQRVTVGEGEKQAVKLRLLPLSALGRTDGPTKPVPVLPTALLAGGSALLAVGLTVGFVGVQKASDAPTRDGEDAMTARRMGLAGDIVGGVGVLAAGTGLTLLILDKVRPKKHTEAKPTTGWVAPVVTPGGAALVGTF